MPNSNDATQRGQGRELEEQHTVDVQIHSRKGKPLSVSLTAYVLIQLIMGAVTFGASFTYLKGTIQHQGNQIEELRHDRELSNDLLRQMLERQARIEERVEALREDLRRGRR